MPCVQSLCAGQMMRRVVARSSKDNGQGWKLTCRKQRPQETRIWIQVGIPASSVIRAVLNALSLLGNIVAWTCDLEVPHILSFREMRLVVLWAEINGGDRVR